MAELFHIRPERVSGRGQQTKTSWATRLGLCHRGRNAVNAGNGLRGRTIGEK
jgi:hypothetical protein